MENKKSYGLAVLRVLLGLLFLIPGISKITNPSGITGMLTGLGFPAPQFLAWILILSEIIFGATLIFGYKTRYTVWPLVVVLAVAALTVAVPGASENPMGVIIILFHLVAIGGLISIYTEGPGAMSMKN